MSILLGQPGKFNHQLMVITVTRIQELRLASGRGVIFALEVDQAPKETGNDCATIGAMFDI